MKQLTYADYKMEYLKPNGDVESVEIVTLSDKEVARKFANGAEGTTKCFEMVVDVPDFFRSVLPNITKVVYTLLPGNFEYRNAEHHEPIYGVDFD